jgi:uncharacterized membrane protein YqjE
MIERLSAAGSIAVRHAGAYLDLILSDLDVTARAVRRRAIAASIMWFALLLAVSLACVWIIAATWDTDARLWAIGGLLGFFLAVAAVAFWRFRTLDGDAPALLAQTTREWSKDRRLLEELLAHEREGAAHD